MSNPDIHVMVLSFLKGGEMQPFNAFKDPRARQFVLNPKDSEIPRHWLLHAVMGLLDRPPVPGTPIAPIYSLYFNAAVPPGLKIERVSKWLKACDLLAFGLGQAYVYGTQREADLCFRFMRASENQGPERVIVLAGTSAENMQPVGGRLADW